MDGIPIFSRTECLESEAQEKNRKKNEKKATWEDKDVHLSLDALFTPEPELLGFASQPKWKTLEVVVYSGAAESVAPEKLAPWIPTRPSKGSARGQTYVSASGEKLPNQGEKQLELMTDEGEWARATFQVADVTRPLCSVSRVCGQGNKVVFGSGGGYVENLATGKKSYFQRQHNVYVMNMHVLEGNDDQGHSEGFARQGP